jgi:hypothetical protein
LLDDRQSGSDEPQSGSSLPQWEIAFRAECFENGLLADLRGKKTSELDHFGRARHPMARVQVSTGLSAFIAASHNLLNVNENISNGRVRRWLTCDSGRGRELCVFFAQHSHEKRVRTLWEWRFFIAPQT